MISKEYYKYFISQHICDERFVKMAKALGMENADKADDFITALEKLQNDCGVGDLKMSDFGIEKIEADVIAANARETMGGLFEADPCELGHEDCAEIVKKSYR